MDILGIPFIYNLRFLVAGDQKRTKKFIADNYKKYNCKSVLDLGCGTGDFSTLFSKKNYLGIDLNCKYIEFARKNYRYKFLCQDLAEFKPTERFDTTIFISTLHHLSDGQIKDIFKKVVEITKNVIIIVDLNPATDPLRKLLIDLDRGEYVRSTKQKQKLLTQFGEILTMKHFNTGLASQTGIVLKPKI